MTSKNADLVSRQNDVQPFVKLEIGFTVTLNNTVNQEGLIFGHIFLFKPYISRFK